MKKFLALFFAIIMILSVASCGSSSDDNSGVSNNAGTNATVDNGADNGSGNGESGSGSGNGGSEPTGTPDIKMEDIVFSSVFAHGVAIVNLRDDANKAYVINKAGKKIFDLDITESQASSIRYLEFENGLLVYGGKCYDADGTVTLPESVGATSFVALEEGKYIIAEKITSSYDTSKKELGVLNTDFEWIVPLKEGYYELYHSNSTMLYDFFWNSVVYANDDSPKFINPDYDDNIYMSNGEILNPQKVNMNRFLDIYDGKYILALGESTLGVLNMNGDWVYGPSAELFAKYEDWENKVYIAGDFVVVENNDTYSPNCGITYYDILNKTSSTISGESIYASYMAGDRFNGVDRTGATPVYTKGQLTSVDDFEGYGSDNGKYIVISCEHEIIAKCIEYGETVENIERVDVFSVCDKSLNWIKNDIIADDVRVIGDLLYVKVSDEELYCYDLTTGAIVENAPNPDGDDDDYVEEEGDNDFDIVNLYRVTDFINKRAAVALWNYEVNEMYITLINEDGEFLFEPVKTAITKTNGFNIFFDGDNIVISNSDGFGTGYIYNDIKIYVYGDNGALKGEWKPSEVMSGWNCTFEYSNGVFVFDISHGQYSDYYRQSEVRYYTPDFKLLF